MKYLFVALIIVLCVGLNAYDFVHEYTYYEDFNVENQPNEPLWGNIESHRGYRYPDYDAGWGNFTFTIDKPETFAKNVVLSFNFGDLVPFTLEYPFVHRVKVNWGDGSEWTNWKIVDDSTNPETFTHDYNINDNQQFDVQVKLDCYTGGGDMHEYTRTIPFSIFPTPDENLYNSYGDELTSFISSDQIKKPVLIVEGFDPLDEMCSADYFNLTPDYLLSEFINNDYDLYFLNFDTAGRDMRDNAMSVLGALRFIAERYPYSEGIRLLGISMGGVIGRYSLAWAEENDVDHYTTMFISLDSPQRGANINSDLQQNAYNAVSNAPEYLAFLQESLSSQSARQLLRWNVYEHHETSGYTYGEGGPELNEFYDELHNLCNGFGYSNTQNNITNLAISNGKTSVTGNLSGGDFIYLDGELTGLGFDQNGILTIFSDAFDTQPSSTFGLEVGAFTNVINLYSHPWLPVGVSVEVVTEILYDPAFIPTISSLDLQGIAIDNRDAINIPSNELVNYSPFDECIVQNGLNHDAIHGEVTSISTNAITSWFNDTVYNKIGDIEGHIDVNGVYDVEDVDIRVTCLGPWDVLPIIHPDENGYYGFPNMYITDTQYRIEFMGDGIYKRIETVEVDYLPSGNHTVEDVTLDLINNDYILVNADPNSSAFHTIQEAVDYLENYGDGMIIVQPGTYSGSGNTNIYWNPSLAHITFHGASNQNTIIDCQESGKAFYLCGLSYNENDIIENFKIINAEQGIVIENYGDQQPIVRNNVIMDCEIPYVDTINSGAGISCKGPALIENNEIINCVRQWIENNYVPFELYANGGGIFAENNSYSSSLIIKENLISECEARDGGGIYCTGEGIIEVHNNIFSLNSLCADYNAYYDFDGYSIVMFAFDCCDLRVIGNVFADNIDPNNIQSDRVITLYSYENYNVVENTIRNNSIIDNANMGGLWLTVDYCPEFNVNNNIFGGLEYGIYSEDGNWATPVIDYCLFDDIDNYNVSSNLEPLSANCIEEEDPQLDPDSFMPIWNSITKSLCIDTGDPTITDTDDTPSDIGAVCATPHKYDVIELPSPDIDSGWKWLSIPALDDVYSTTGYDPDVAEYLLESITGLPYPAILDKVELPGGDDEIVLFQNQWQNFTHQFESVNGYKFHMNEAATLYVPGFVENPNTQMDLTGGVDNWIGYFLEDSQLVTEAFSQIWDDLYVIQHQHWCMTKINGVWYYWQTKREPVLEYGDMINVKCYNSHSAFQWCNDTPGDDEESIPEPEYFFFTEKADYIPIYVEFDPEDIPAEVGVFVDGVCKGAAVVEGENAQILAYIVDGEQGNLEFEFYYNSRSQNKRLTSYNCLSSQNTYQVQQQIDVKEKPDAWLVTFREESNIISAPDNVSLSNYPNPFNPTTTIAYGLPYEDRISLSIYNIKGQLVKQIVSGTQPEGYYEVVWDGKDTTGRRVASGIYYYRITACGKILNKKMLMLK